MKTAICTIIKNEHLFLKEWIEWHLGIGFNAIHLFEDKDSKSHKEICKKYNNVYLRRYEDDEEVRNLLEYQGSSHRQKVLYDYFARQSKEVYDWVGFFDLDEFVMFADGYNLDKLCVEFEPYSAVLLNWKMMGASGHINRPRTRVVESYTQECETLLKDKEWCYKSFVNINRFQGFENLHMAKGYVNTNHERITDDLYYDKCWLNHYFTKSFEDWLDRIYKRGGTLKAHRTLYDFYSCNPDMAYLKEITYEFLASRMPVGTHTISRELGLCCGGNLYDIRLMNCKNIGSNMTDEERLDSAINEAAKYGFKNNGKDKLIHFVWIGKNKLPEIAFKCLDSWKKYAKDYTVCLWNENNADFSLPFVKLAYNEGQYGIAADCIRLEIIYKYGGIYLDIDVELIKELPELPENVLALEQTYEDKQGIAPGLIIKAKKGNEVIYDFMSIYKYMYFNAKKRHLYIQPGLFQNYFSARGYKGQSSFLGFDIYAPEYFAPKRFFDKKTSITENTIAIHHYTQTWI